MNHSAGVTILAGTLAAACGAHADRSGPLVRDSTGIRIVENRLSSGTEPTPPFTVDPEPILDLGAENAASSPVFNRIAGVRLLDTGVLVADEGESRLQAFDADGNLRWTAGRRGDGPGEYRQISAIGVGPSDSVWVWDFGLRRLTILDGGGQPGRILTLEAPLSAVGAAGRLDDGDFILQEYWSPGPAAAGAGLHRAPAAIVRFASDGTSLDTVVVLPGREAFLTVEDGRGVMATPLFARRTIATARGSAIFAGDQERFEIGRYDAGGALRMLIRLSGPDLSIDDNDAAALVDAMLEDVPAPERQTRRSFLESMDRPSTRPAFEALIATDSGLWVEDWSMPGRDASRRSWTVFAADGTLAGRVTMPPGFEPYDVRSDRVAGVWRDALDVEHVRIHRIAMPGHG